MALGLKDPEADRLAREVAARARETLTTTKPRSASRSSFKGDDFARTDIGRVI